MRATRILLVCLIGAATALPVYNLRDTHSISISPRERVVIEQPEENDAPEMWVVGHFPSEKIMVEEGRYGDRRKEKTDEKLTWVQKFTFHCGYAKSGDVLPVEFWYLKPHFAEQYFNDPRAYEQLHGKQPEIKVIEFKVGKEDL